MTDTSAVSEAPVDAPAPDQPQAGADQAAQAKEHESSASGAIDRAFAKLEAEEKAAAEKAPKQDQDGKAPEKKDVKSEQPAKAEKPEAKPKEDGEPAERDRGPDGKFVSKEQSEAAKADADKAVQPEDAQKATNFSDAPPRFSADAKAAWKDAPEPVRAEITRAVKELEGGIEQYRQAYEPFREFHKELQQKGQSFREVLAHYTGIEDLLARDPVQGLNRICENMGTSLRTVAAHVLGQTPDQAAQQNDATIRELRQEIAGLKKQVGGFSENMETQQRSAAEKEISAFAAQPGHERFDELADDIVFLVETGRASDLSQAYELAARLNPAPQPASPALTMGQQDPKADLEAQTRKGSLSVAGSPATGSNPGTVKKPAKTAAEAVDRAFASMSF